MMIECLVTGVMTWLLNSMDENVNVSVMFLKIVITITHELDYGTRFEML